MTRSITSWLFVATLACGGSAELDQPVPPPGAKLSPVGAAEPLAAPEAAPAAAPASQAEAPSVSEPAPQQEGSVPTAQVPAGVSTLKPKLGARDTKDLPTDDEIRSTPQAEESLLYLIETADTLSLKARAIEAMGALAGESPSAETYLANTLTGTGHAKLRAAAIMGLNKVDLESHAVGRGALVSTLADPNPRLSVESAKRLATVEAAQVEIAQLREAGKLTPTLEDALQTP